MTQFEKWEGLGNDFLLIESDVTAEAAVRLCDRRRGVGADGVLSVLDAGTKPKMIVHNADGSRPEMCGNGLRCVAGYLAARGAAGVELLVSTDAGDRRCAIVPVAVDLFEVTVDMGKARFGADLELASEGRAHRFRAVDVGNPHAVTFDPYDQAAIDRLGPVAATKPEGGTNVEFCRVGGSGEGPVEIDVTVWERGVGRTLACGTGACAVAAAACDAGLAPYDQPMIVRLPGGILEVTVAAGTLAIRMKGPARRVFVGEVVAR
jgi:diaminopimelate epimerase